MAKKATSSTLDKVDPNNKLSYRPGEGQVTEHGGEVSYKIGKMKERSNDVTLTAEELLELIPKDLKCPVFGIKFSFGKGNDWKFKQYSMSVDRIDNNKGYHKDNVVIVSSKANTMKSSDTLKELYQVADFYYGLEKRSKSSA